ncbi:hypothetical protein YC2023_044207 [Brassica napus]
MAGDYGLPFSSVVFMLYVWSDLNTASSSSLCFAVAWLVVGSLRFCWGGSLVLRGLKFSILMILPVVADLLVCSFDLAASLD